jgi:cyclophilin family peptidyl-prolyl cis-trans isomerase
MEEEVRMRLRVSHFTMLAGAAALALALSAHAHGTHGDHKHPAATSADPAAAAKGTEGAAEAAKSGVKAAPAAAAAASDAAVKAIDAQVAKAAALKKEAGWRTRLPMPTLVKFDASKQYLAHMTTTKGDIVLKLMPDVAPFHVTNFIYLTRLGFYDGLTFHRVIPNFMAQGGCPVGTGGGNPGYGFNGEFSPSVRHSRPGLLSTANTGQPNSDGSQFFLTFVPTPHLDGKHTIYGEVVGGMDVLKALEAKGSPSGATAEKLAITKVTIEVK